jgi:CheY-like chemotaxis protein
MTDASDKKLILLEDDTPANIHVAREILKDLYKIRVATSGMMALKAVKMTPAPDLILLDVVMPEMDGYEVCAKLKADLSTRDIPVIFLTAMTQPEEETRGFAVGAVDYIHKPFSPPVVLARVRAHLTLSEAREQLMNVALATFAPRDAPAGTFEAQAAAPLMAQLESLLETNDVQAAELIQQVTDSLAGGVDPKLLESLRHLVEKFDFEGALFKLAEIATQCNLRLDKHAVRIAGGKTHSVD